MRGFAAYLKDEDGAVAMDWIALTAGMVMMGLSLVYAVFNNGVSSLVDNLNSEIAAIIPVAPGAAPGASSGSGEAAAYGPTEPETPAAGGGDVPDAVASAGDTGTGDTGETGAGDTGSGKTPPGWEKSPAKGGTPPGKANGVKQNR